MILGAHFLLLTFFENFQTTLFPKMTSNFWQLLLNWVQDLKTFYGAGYWFWAYRNCLVECATVCVKSVVILRYIIKYMVDGRLVGGVKMFKKVTT